MLLLDILGDETESKSGRLSTTHSDLFKSEKRTKQRSSSKNRDGKSVETTSEGNVISEESIRKSERRRQREERKKRHDEKDSEKQKTDALKAEEPVFDIWSSIFGFITPAAEPVIVPSSPKISKRESSEKRKEKSRNHRSKKEKFEDVHLEKSPRSPESYSQLDNEPQTISEQSKPEISEFVIHSHSSRIFQEPAVVNESTPTTNVLAASTLPSTITATSFITKSRRRASALLFRTSKNQLDGPSLPCEDPQVQQMDKEVSREPVSKPQRAGINTSRRLSTNATNFPWFLPLGRTISDPIPPSSRNEDFSGEPDSNPHTTSLKSSVNPTPMQSNDDSYRNETISLLKANLNHLKTQQPDVVRNPSNTQALSSEPKALYSASRSFKSNLTSRHHYHPSMRFAPLGSVPSLLADCSSSAEVASLLGDGLSCGFCQSVQLSLPRKMPSVSPSTVPQRSVQSGVDIIPIQTLLHKPCRIQIVSRPAKGSAMQPVLLIELALRSSSSKLCTLTYAIPEDICEVRAGFDDESTHLNGNPDPTNRTGSILRGVGSSKSQSSSSWSNLEKQAGQFGLTICCREPNPDVALVFPTLTVRDDVLKALSNILHMFSPYGS